MRPVNLLPEGDRPRLATGRYRGSGYLVVGGLALVLVALVSYTLTANQVTSRNAQAAQAGRDADEAERRAARLGAFGDFAQTKQTREASVKSLAAGRFDWERLSLEMARVMPPGVFVTEVNAAAAGSPDGATGASAAASGSPSASSGSGSSPQMKLTGCAPTQPDVATTMVRLRGLHRAKEVNLEDSTRDDQAAASGGASASTSTGAGGTSGSGGCGTRNGSPYYKFIASVSFEPVPPRAPVAPEGSPDVPRSLGGGA